MTSRVFTASLAALGDLNDGVTSRQRLLALEISEDEIKDAVSRTLLVPALRGVYLVGRRRLTPRGLRQAALAYAGPSMLAAATAGEHYGWFRERAGVAIINTKRSRPAVTLKTLVPMQDGRPGLIRLKPTSVMNALIVDGLPTASVPRALIDVAGTDGEARLARAWAQADYRKQLDLGAVERELAACRRQGAPLVRALYLKHPGRHRSDATHFNSPSEVDFRQLVADAGLPMPEVNIPVWVAGRWYVVDYLWPDLQLVVELDDPSHDRPLARQRDAARDQDLMIAGYDAIHFLTDDLKRAPAEQMQRLGFVIERQRARMKP